MLHRSPIFHSSHIFWICSAIVGWTLLVFRLSISVSPNISPLYSYIPSLCPVPDKKKRKRRGGGKRGQRGESEWKFAGSIVNQTETLLLCRYLWSCCPVPRTGPAGSRVLVGEPHKMHTIVGIGAGAQQWCLLNDGLERTMHVRNSCKVEFSNIFNVVDCNRFSFFGAKCWKLIFHAFICKLSNSLLIHVVYFWCPFWCVFFSSLWQDF